MEYVKIDGIRVKIEYDQNSRLYYIDHYTEVDKQLLERKCVCCPAVGGETIEILLNKIKEKCEKQHLTFSLK